MTYRALIMDEATVSLLQWAENLTTEWLDALPNSSTSGNVRIVEIGQIVYLLSKSASNASRLLVIYAPPDGLFSNFPSRDTRIEAFRRALRGSLRALDSTIVIPSGWRPHLHGQFFSFQSNNFNTGIKDRIYIDLRPLNRSHVLVYKVGFVDHDTDTSVPDYQLFISAIEQFAQALAATPTASKGRPGVRGYELDLTSQPEAEFTHGLTTQQWYDTRLTREQRNFVDFPPSQAIRLRGAAGTGKTLAMVIKCLRMLHHNIDAGTPFRTAFLTHSNATSELVKSMIRGIDERAVLYSPYPGISLTMGTLQHLAANALKYDLTGLTPLSTDGTEGRTLQMELLLSVVRSYRVGDWIAYEDSCSEPFRRYMQEDLTSSAGKYFLWEILNEFACVLDAEGVRESVERKKQYLQEKRKNWMMILETPSERQVILDLYAMFRQELRDMKAIGVDQMISDFLGYLDSFQWDTMRSERGYDAVFVDEMHLFNRQERMVYHYLIRDPKKLPVVIMAYDAKQSPRDTFLGLTAGESDKYNFWKDARLGQVQSFKLDSIFRYSPQIADFLRVIDQAFPGVGLEEEWPKFSGISMLPQGPAVVCIESKDARTQYEHVFARAAKAVKALGKGRRVAVLCCSYQLFEKYLVIGAGQRKILFLSITSRDDLSSLANAGKRFIFSMPEFVAGLQFDTVFLIDVNQGEIPDARHSTGAFRRFLSMVYLGASRAERCLEVYATKEEGGLADAINSALESGVAEKRLMTNLGPI